MNQRRINVVFDHAIDQQLRQAVVRVAGRVLRWRRRILVSTGEEMSQCVPEFRKMGRGDIEPVLVRKQSLAVFGVVVVGVGVARIVVMMAVLAVVVMRASERHTRRHHTGMRVRRAVSAVLNQPMQDRTDPDCASEGKAHYQVGRDKLSKTPHHVLHESNELRPAQSSQTSTAEAVLASKFSD